MKTQKLIRLILGAVAAVLLSGSLTSCGSDDWWGGPPPGWTNTVSDNRLSGYWQLVQYNSDDVGPGDANYLYFNGNGAGRYYYLDNGMRYTESIRYWCQPSVSGTSNYQINIQYEHASPVTENYWFTHSGSTLWLQWQTSNGRVVTYVYDRIPGAPW